METANNNNEEKRSKASPNDHLANERTFLAWIRTSIAIMGFGFVVVKFSFFIRQLTLFAGDGIVLPEQGYSSAIGISLVITGAIMTLLSFLRYRTIEKHLLRGTYFPSFLLSLLLTVAIGLVGLLLVLYLFQSV